MITLDNSDRRHAELADLCRRHRVVPTIYVCTGVVGTNRHFWFRDVPRSAVPRELPHAELTARVGALGFDRERVYPESERLALSRDELEQMRDAVDFQSHTRFHPMLTACTIDVCNEELVGSRSDIAAITGSPARHLAYPNGDYTSREMRAAEMPETASPYDRPPPAGRDLDTDPFKLPIIGGGSRGGDEAQPDR